MWVFVCFYKLHEIPLTAFAFCSLLKSVWVPCGFFIVCANLISTIILLLLLFPPFICFALWVSVVFESLSHFFSIYNIISSSCAACAAAVSIAKWKFQQWIKYRTNQCVFIIGLLVAPQIHRFAALHLNVLDFVEAQISHPMKRCSFRVTECGRHTANVGARMRIEEIFNVRIEWQSIKIQYVFCDFEWFQR